MTAKELLFDELNSFGFPVFLQGSLNADEPYPDTFITFFTDDVLDNSQYDDDTVSWDWNFSVILYSNDPALLSSKSDEIRVALKQAGFIPQGKGRDVPSDEPSHTGWAIDFIYLEH